MPRILRIDSAVIVNGALNIGITTSLGALPATASHQGHTFASKAALVQAMQDFENSLNSEQLCLFALATAYKADNTLSNLATAVGKTVKLSLTSGAQMVTIA